jgi:outer membrane receptor protein involved in Fe transport
VSRTFAPTALRAAAEWPTRTGTWGVLARREPRAPSSGEYLGDNNGIQHNPDLRAEEARSASLLHRAAGKGEGWSASVQTTLYANVYDSPIRLAGRGASPFLHYENGADYRALGGEGSAFASLPFAEALLSLSVQDAEILEGLYAGNRPAYLSETELHAELFAKPAAGARIGALLDARGPYYPGDADIPDSRRPAEWELGAHAGYARGHVRVAIDVRNLFDRRYRDFAYGPRSGRNGSATLSFSF